MQQGYNFTSRGEVVQRAPEPLEVVSDEELSTFTLDPMTAEILKAITPSKNPFPIPPLQKYLINESTDNLLSIVDRMSDRGNIVNVLVSGPQGVGKSELAEQYAATRNKPYAVIEVGRLSDPSQIFGYMDLQDGETTYVPGIFTRAITFPGTVIHLQEINRPENDKALNALFSILDDKQRRIWVDEMSEYVEVAKGVVFFATLNEGFEFIGTLPLDEALRNRFPIKITLKRLPKSQELMLLTVKQGLGATVAGEVITTVEELRGNTQHPTSVSTRDLMFIGMLVSEGASVDLAVQTVVGGDSDALESMNLNKHMRGQQGNVLTDSYRLMASPVPTTFR